MWFGLITKYSLLVLALWLPESDGSCISIKIEPDIPEHPWKTDVTLVCMCDPSCACKDPTTESLRQIEVNVGISYLADTLQGEDGVGRYVIKDVTREKDNNLKFSCAVSRVGASEKINFTVIEPPPIITDFGVSPLNNSILSRSVAVSWSTPSHYPETTHFVIDILDTVKGESTITSVSNSSVTLWNISSLVPARKYNLKITNFNKLGSRESSSAISIVTLEEAPEGPPMAFSVEGISPEAILIQWSPPQHFLRHGIIKGYEVRCVLQNSVEPLVYTQSVPAEEVNWTLSEIEEEQTYSCTCRAFTAVGTGPFTTPSVGTTFKKPIVTLPPTIPVPVTDKQRDTKASKQTAALVIGICIAIVAVGLAAVALFVMRRKIFKPQQHTRLTSDDNEEDGQFMKNIKSQETLPVIQPVKEEKKVVPNKVLTKAPAPVYKPGETTPPTSNKPTIPVIEFPDHVEQLHQNSNVGFNREYNSLNAGSGYTADVGKRAANKSKNRYYNVQCYDHTRVQLTPVGESDYINANYVDGYNQTNAYIATQGPLPNTCIDFWRMVWEQNSASVVMVTNLVELARVKCHQYYPDSGSLSFGPITVTLIDSMPLADFTIRILKLEMAGCDEVHNVKHFHFTSWPDHGVPPFSNAILSFVRHVKAANTVENGPVVVHCSAGVGRTGTFMAIDSMLDMSEKEGAVDIFGYVTQMRSCRPSMVQTEDQYIFIHDAILEALTCGVTEVRARDIPNHFQWLRDKDSYTNNIRLKDEYERLGYNIRDLSHQMTTAQMDQNASKNRSRSFIPYDQGRVWLFPLPKQPYSNYINASYIDGFRHRKAYVATQSPLPQTMEDYWRMVWELHSLTLVMLNREDETETFDPYFPLEGAAEFGNIRVEFVRKDEHRDFMVTSLRIVNTKEGLTRTISHFQYFGWPEDSTPTSSTSLLEMITRISKSQSTCSNKYPIIAHCEYGMGRTGAFLALCICLDRMKVENVVDVFQTVRTMRSQRPYMVNTPALYEFIFTCLVQYLQTLDLYANFK